MKKQIYSISDVVEATGLCKSSVYKAIKDGELEAKKYGTRTLVTASSLETFIANLPIKSQRGVQQNENL